MNHLLLMLSMMYSPISSLPMNDAPPVPSAVVLTPFSNVAEVTNKKIGQLINPHKAFSFIQNFPDSGRKHAILEQESFVSMQDSKYGYLQQFVASFYNPKPIVDTIQEHEKYGNDGEKFRSVGVVVVAGLEGISNILNAAVEVPFEAIRQISRKISTSINTVGGKLVGL